MRQAAPMKTGPSMRQENGKQNGAVTNGVPRAAASKAAEQDTAADGAVGGGAAPIETGKPDSLKGIGSGKIRCLASVCFHCVPTEMLTEVS